MVSKTSSLLEFGGIKSHASLDLPSFWVKEAVNLRSSSDRRRDFGAQLEGIIYEHTANEGRQHGLTRKKRLAASTSSDKSAKATRRICS